MNIKITKKDESSGTRERRVSSSSIMYGYSITFKGVDGKEKKGEIWNFQDDVIRPTLSP